MVVQSTSFVYFGKASCSSRCRMVDKKVDAHQPTLYTLEKHAVTDMP